MGVGGPISSPLIVMFCLSDSTAIRGPPSGYSLFSCILAFDDGCFYWASSIDVRFSAGWAFLPALGILG